MEVICLEDRAYFALIDEVVKYIKVNHGVKEYKWITGEQAMERLHITSRTTLQKFRDEGKIRFSQPEKRIILYDSDSIDEFLIKNSRDTF